MVRPIEITSEMHKNREENMDRIISKINRDIEAAVKRGQNTCYFDCGKSSPFYQEVRKDFENYGYRIRPTGNIGGVWQLTENIDW